MIAHCVDRATTFPSASAASSLHAHCLLPLSVDLVMGRLAVFVHRLTIAADFTYENIRTFIFVQSRIHKFSKKREGSPPPFQNPWIHCTFTIHSLALRKTLYQLRSHLSQMRFINYNLRVSYGKKRHTEKKISDQFGQGVPTAIPLNPPFPFQPPFSLAPSPQPLVFSRVPFRHLLPLSFPFFPHIPNFH